MTLHAITRPGKWELHLMPAVMGTWQEQSFSRLQEVHASRQRFSQLWLSGLQQNTPFSPVALRKFFSSAPLRFGWVCSVLTWAASQLLCMSCKFSQGCYKPFLPQLCLPIAQSTQKASIPLHGLHPKISLGAAQGLFEGKEQYMVLCNFKHWFMWVLQNHPAKQGKWNLAANPTHWLVPQNLLRREGPIRTLERSSRPCAGHPKSHPVPASADTATRDTLSPEQHRPNRCHVPNQLHISSHTVLATEHPDRTSAELLG